MKIIDTGFDPILNSNYELCAFHFSELKEEARFWYKDVDLSKFDNRNIHRDSENTFVTMKRSGLISNLFFAYREDEKYYLMDGFNRLFTDYGKIDANCTVYLKVLTNKMSDNHLMSIMFSLNLWKLSNENTMGGFSIDEFFDRGVRLFLFAKFGIEIYAYKIGDWEKREKDTNDIIVLDYYFRSERESCGYFKMRYNEVAVLMNNPNIINDIKEIIKSNSYLEKSFENYEDYLQGFVMFLAERRIKGDNEKYEFQTYLDKLYEDKKFFKKLQGMSGTDSTRQNVYKFFRGNEKSAENSSKLPLKIKL